MLYPINEIFRSIQGEGFFTGTPSIFIRFSGCNLKCPWCDTNHTEHRNLELEQIMNQIDHDYPNAKKDNIVITGGEPTIQPDENMSALVSALRKWTEGGLICVETNGTLPVTVQYDFVTVSPKLGVTTYYPLNSLKGDELKIVFDPNMIATLGEEFIGKIPSGLRFNHFFIQPLSQDYKPALDFILQYPGWRLSLQTHRMIGVA